MGRHAILHYLKKIWPWRKRHNLKEFRENYVAEGAARYFRDLREISHFPSQCTTCGLCDFVCPIVNEKKITDFIGPMRLVSSAMRGGTLLFAAVPSLSVLACDACQECGRCESVCPEQIPMRELARCYLQQIDEVNSLKK